MGRAFQSCRPPRLVAGKTRPSGARGGILACTGKQRLHFAPTDRRVQALQRRRRSNNHYNKTNHPALAPEGVFEYQHSAGRNVEESLLDGFTQWAKTDLIALIEALQPKPPTCNVLDMEIPERNGRPAYRRRAVLGPVTHLQQYPRDIPEQTNAHSAGGNQGEHCEGHEFCPCCLLTSSFEAFKELIESDSFYGLRLFAMRNQSGNPQADCRVNGDDWEKGAEALRKYVGTWPVGGLEFRKQYVVLQTIKNRG